MKQFSEFPPARRAVLFLSSGCLTGYIPVASGTVATLLAIALFWPLTPLNLWSLPRGPLFIGLLAVVCGVAVALAEVAERTYGEKDSHKIVIDEIAGFFVAMAFVPFQWPHVLAAFVLFRFFDVAKPPPIRRLQSLPGGWGVVVDDLLAGLYTCLLVHLLRLTPLLA